MVGFKIQERKEPKDNRTENKYRLNTIGGKGGSEGFGGKELQREESLSIIRVYGTLGVYEKIVGSNA